MQKIRLNIENNPVDLYPEESIPVTIRTPFLRLGDGQPSGSFNFRIPLSDNNTKALVHPQRLSMYPLNSLTKSFTLSVKGIQIMEGVAEFDNTTTGDTEIFLGTSVSAFFARLQQTRLADYTYGGPIPLGTGYDVGVNTLFTFGKTLGNPQYYVFPVYNRWLYNHQLSTTTSLQTTPADKLDGIKLYDFNTDGDTFDEREIIERSSQNAIYYDNTTLKILPEAVITPFPRINFVLDSLLSELGYTLLNNLFSEHPERKDECLYSNYDWKNDYADTFTGDCYLNLEKFMPDYSVWDFFKHLENKYNFTFYFNFFEKTVRMVYNDSLFSAESKDYSRHVERGYNIKNQKPTEAVLQMKHTEFDVFEPSASVRYGARTFRGDLMSIPSGMEPEEVYYYNGNSVEPLYRLTQSAGPFVFKTSPENKQPTFRVGEIRTGAGEPQEISTELSHPVMSNFIQFQQYLGGIVRNPVYFRACVVAIPVRSFAYNPEGETPCPLLSMIYRGEVEAGVDTGFNNINTQGDRLDLIYPFGNMDCRDVYDDGNLYDYSIALINTHQAAGSGVLENYWTNTLDWTRAEKRMVSFNLELSETEFRDFRFDVPVKINGVLYLPVELRSDITPLGLGIIEMDTVTFG